MDIQERLKKVVEQSKFTPNAFASHCGIKQPTLDKQLKGLRGVSLDTIVAISHSFPELSMEWLLRGSGPMFSEEVSTPDESADRLNRLVDTITTLQDIINEKNATIKELSNEILKLKANQK